MYLPNSPKKAIVTCPICLKTQGKCKKSLNHGRYSIVLRIYDRVEVTDGRIGKLIYIGRLNKSTGLVPAVVRLNATDNEPVDFAISNIASLKQVKNA